MDTNRRVRFARWSITGVGVFGSLVLACGLLAGCTSTRDTPAVRVPVTTSPHTTGAPGACTQNDLSARYAGGGDGGQTFMGEILVWNTAASPCQVRGLPSFTAYFANGSPDSLAQINGGRSLISITLRARMSVYRDGTEPSGYLDATLAGPQFNASGAHCSGTARLTPATFVLSIGAIHLRVDNRDAAALQNKTLTGCDGRILMEQPSQIK